MLLRQVAEHNHGRYSFILARACQVSGADFHYIVRDNWHSAWWVEELPSADLFEERYRASFAAIYTDERHKAPDCYPIATSAFTLQSPAVHNDEVVAVEGDGTNPPQGAKEVIRHLAAVA